MPFSVPFFLKNGEQLCEMLFCFSACNSPFKMGSTPFAATIKMADLLQLTFNLRIIAANRQADPIIMKIKVHALSKTGSWEIRDFETKQVISTLHLFYCVNLHIQFKCSKSNSLTNLFQTCLFRITNILSHELQHDVTWHRAFEFLKWQKGNELSPFAIAIINTIKFLHATENNKNSVEHYITLALHLHIKNIPSSLGEMVESEGYAIFSKSGQTGYSTWQNFCILKPCSLIMQHMKFEIHAYIGFWECAFWLLKC